MKTILLVLTATLTACHHMPTSPADIFDPPAFSGATPAVLPPSVTLAPVDVGTGTPAPSAPAAPAVPPTPAAGTPVDVGTVTTAPSTPGAPVVPPSPAAGMPQDIGTVYALTTNVAHASLSVGNGSSAILFTAVATGASGNAITIQCADAVDAAGTAVTVTGTAILIIPASKSRMLIGGITNPDVSGWLDYAGTQNGHPAWSRDGTLVKSANNVILNRLGAVWEINRNDQYSAGIMNYESIYADGLTGWTISVGTGQPTVVAYPTDAANVVSAITHSAPASTLVTAVCVGDGTGSITPLAATHLDGGVITPAVIWNP